VRRGIIVDGEFFAFLSRSGFVQQAQAVGKITRLCSQFSAVASVEAVEKPYFHAII